MGKDVARGSISILRAAEFDLSFMHLSSCQSTIALLEDSSDGSSSASDSSYAPPVVARRLQRIPPQTCPCWMCLVLTNEANEGRERSSL